jgi:DNA-binding LytR/AlgR family response regulator
MIRALIVDDETPARSELCYLLEETKQVEVVGEAGNVRDAIALIKKTPADVIFLDVNMPGVTGLQLAEGLKTHPHPPALVFVTAHSHFAVKAFELNALDYLVKPVDLNRLKATVEKVRIRTGAGTVGTAGADGADDSGRVMVTKSGKKLFILIKDISFVMAKDDYSYLFTATDRYLSTSSLTKLEDQLKDNGIFRVHRRYLINLAKVKSISPQQGGTLTLAIDGSAEEIPVSRRRVPALKQVLGL